MLSATSLRRQYYGNVEGGCSHEGVLYREEALSERQITGKESATEIGSEFPRDCSFCNTLTCTSQERSAGISITADCLCLTVQSQPI
ncbi:hypothetical protein J6590_084691 [Homalodisca vitripennis]|nr:hypothetical protein J6590_084691 [Homalodisca vitripennis]